MTHMINKNKLYKNETRIIFLWTITTIYNNGHFFFFFLFASAIPWISPRSLSNGRSSVLFICPGYNYTLLLIKVVCNVTRRVCGESTDYLIEWLVHSMGVCNSKCWHVYDAIIEMSWFNRHIKREWLVASLFPVITFL